MTQKGPDPQWGPQSTCCSALDPTPVPQSGPHRGPHPHWRRLRCLTEEIHLPGKAGPSHLSPAPEGTRGPPPSTLGRSLTGLNIPLCPQDGESSGKTWGSGGACSGPPGPRSTAWLFRPFTAPGHPLHTDALGRDYSKTPAASEPEDERVQQQSPLLRDHPPVSPRSTREGLCHVSTSQEQPGCLGGLPANLPCAGCRRGDGGNTASGNSRSLLPLWVDSQGQQGEDL